MTACELPDGSVTFSRMVAAQSSCRGVSTLSPVLARHVTFRPDGSVVVGVGGLFLGPTFQCTCGTVRKSADRCTCIGGHVANALRARATATRTSRWPALLSTWTKVLELVAGSYLCCGRLQPDLLAAQQRDPTIAKDIDEKKEGF